MSARLNRRIRCLAHAHIAQGSDGYSHAVRKRLALTGFVALFLIVSLLTLLTAISTILLASGQSPFTVGNLGLFAACGLLLLGPCLNRYGKHASAFYILAVSSSLLLLVHSQVGHAQGMHNSYILLAGLIPLLFGAHPFVLTTTLMVGMIGLFIATERIFPPVGDAIRDRPAETVALLRYASISMVIIMVFVIVRRSVQAADQAEHALRDEHERTDELLDNVLPRRIATRLKAHPHSVIADRHQDVTVLFADIVDFSTRSRQKTSQELVSWLNEIFQEFDVLVAERGLEKIKTVGDAYMVAAGVPYPHRDSAAAMADLALAMLAKADELSKFWNEPFDIRIGMDCGEVVAGVIGASKFTYDIWGAPVNTASRMETNGVPHCIQVTERLKTRLCRLYEFSDRQVIEAKGVGIVPVYLLRNRRVGTVGDAAVAGVELSGS